MKAKGKARPKAIGGPRPDGGGRSGGRGGGGGSGRKHDEEIAKVLIQRDAILTSRKWKSAIAELGGQVTQAFDEAGQIEGAEEFLDND